MKREYWNKIAGNYEAEIFNVLEYDRAGVVLGQIDRFASPRRQASDLGCGIGGFLPLMSSRFKKVVAVDISSRCLARARAKYPLLRNVSYQQADLAAPQTRLPAVDFALSVNAVLTTSPKIRHGMFDAFAKHLRTGAHLVLVVPALESVLLTMCRLDEWHRRDGTRPSAADLRASHQAAARLPEGIVPIDGVPTKHFLEEELILQLENRRLRVTDLLKVEYAWSTEFESPPRWMKKPLPWDWLIVARKVK
jgi:SAM-dependent methyltransferase